MSYGTDQSISFDRAADLPFELATRHLFVINLKPAKVMDLTVPNMLLALADEMIERRAKRLRSARRF